MLCYAAYQWTQPHKAAFDLHVFALSQQPDDGSLSEHRFDDEGGGDVETGARSESSGLETVGEVVEVYGAEDEGAYLTKQQHRALVQELGMEKMWIWQSIKILLSDTE